MQTLVMMALKVESQGLFEAAGFIPVYCGVGAVKAAHHLTKSISNLKPGRVVNLGTAGSHRFPTGQLIECTSFVQRAPHEFLKLSAPRLEVTGVTDLQKAVCGSADFIEKSQPITPCDVFDMEAYALAYVCQEMKVPFTCIKVVSDTSNENLVNDWKANLTASAQALLTQLRKMKLESH